MLFCPCFMETGEEDSLPIFPSQRPDQRLCYPWAGPPPHLRLPPSSTTTNPDPKSLRKVPDLIYSSEPNRNSGCAMSVSKLIMRMTTRLIITLILHLSVKGTKRLSLLCKILYSMDTRAQKVSTYQGRLFF